MYAGGGVVAIDTNVLVRFVVADHPAQSLASQKLFASADIYIADTVLLETEWVLRGVYGFARADVCQSLRAVCGLRNVQLADPMLAASVIDWHAAGFDFADAFHMLSTQRAATFASFDLTLVRLAKKHGDRVVQVPVA
jgi:predicted nucleic-acid-binding protein